MGEEYDAAEDAFLAGEHFRQRPGDQPLPTGGRECVQNRLIQAIQERRDLGVARYGQPLMTHNGRDALQDAWEEAVDLTVYLTQLRMEADDRTEATQLLRNWLDLHVHDRGAGTVMRAYLLLGGKP
jgi:hypothetical protein